MAFSSQIRNTFSSGFQIPEMSWDKQNQGRNCLFYHRKKPKEVSNIYVNLHRKVHENTAKLYQQYL